MVYSKQRSLTKFSNIEEVTEMGKGIKYILVDIDDNILPTDGHYYRDDFKGLARFANWVDQANHKEIPLIGFCTGRDRNYVESVAFSVLRPNSWSVIESGIALFNPTTKRILINPSLTPEVIEAFESIRRERLPRILKKFPGLFEYPGNMINIALERKFGVDVPIEECYAAVKEEVRDIETRGVITIHHSKIAVDISPQGIDKASGIRFLSEETGIDTSEILGIGDSRGDFPMLKLVGWIGCPHNASDECKNLIKAKRGGYVSTKEYAAGVADVIYEFICRRGSKG